MEYVILPSCVDYKKKHMSLLFGYGMLDSASAMLANNNIDSLEASIHKVLYGFRI